MTTRWLWESAIYWRRHAVSKTLTMDTSTCGVCLPTALWQLSLSCCSALWKWFKTASFRPSATSSVSPLWQVKTDLDRRQNRSFGFRSVVPQKRGFGFKTDPGLPIILERLSLSKFHLKLFSKEANTVRLSSLFHTFMTRSVKKCWHRSLLNGSFSVTGMTMHSVVGVKFKENFKFYISLTIYHFEHFDQIISNLSSF